MLSWTEPRQNSKVPCPGNCKAVEDATCRVLDVQVLDVTMIRAMGLSGIEAQCVPVEAAADKAVLPDAVAEAGEDHEGAAGVAGVASAVAAEAAAGQKEQKSHLQMRSRARKRGAANGMNLQLGVQAAVTLADPLQQVAALVAHRDRRHKQRQ